MAASDKISRQPEKFPGKNLGKFPKLLKILASKADNAAQRERHRLSRGEHRCASTLWQLIDVLLKLGRLTQAVVLSSNSATGR